MPVASIQTRAPQIKPEDIPLEKIDSSKTLTEEQKVTEATRQFEAVLLRQIISQAQKPAFKSSLMPDSGVTGSIYQDMMVNQMADKISASRTLGVAQELEKQVTRQKHGLHGHARAQAEAYAHAQATATGKTEFQKPNESPKNAAPVPATKAPRL